jgi:uncharacterized protein YndB with AHSA1/START domain
MPDAPTVTEHTLVLTRIFDAPRELVWTAWTTPEHIERWLAPRPVTIRPGSVIVDLRVGGTCSLTMVMPDGTEFPNRGTYTEVDAPVRLASHGTVDDHPGLEAVSTVVVLADLGDGRTEVTVTHTMTCSDEMPDLARRGWTQALDQVAEVLASL